jgi:hypothetical protein
MNTKAKTYVAVILIAGAALLAVAGWKWQSENQARFLGMGLLAVLAATRKVRLPKSTSNISIGFLFILLAIAGLSFSEVVVLSCATALAQSLWAMRRPKLIQVLFNVSVLGMSAAAAFGSAEIVARTVGVRALAALMPVATTVFFVLDTAMVAGVVALTEERSLKQVWQQCSLWAFPYYLVGAAIAGLVAASSTMLGWVPALMVLPVMYLIYVYYRMYVERAEMQHS